MFLAQQNVQYRQWVFPHVLPLLKLALPGLFSAFRVFLGVGRWRRNRHEQEQGAFCRYRAIGDGWPLVVFAVANTKNNLQNIGGLNKIVGQNIAKLCKTILRTYHISYTYTYTYTYIYIYRLYIYIYLLWLYVYIYIIPLYHNHIYIYIASSVFVVWFICFPPPTERTIYLLDVFKSPAAV